MRIRLFRHLGTVLFLLCAACGGTRHATSERVADHSRETSKVKNIIILIGDGMGPQAIGLLNLFSKHATTLPSPHQRTTALETMMREGTLGMVTTEPFGAIVVDSAASATQMASGKWALSETIGIDKDGQPVETVLSLAKKRGKSTGLVSDTRLTHATPAAFVAHQRHRSKENQIAEDLVRDGADIMLSGGLRHFIPANVSTDVEMRKTLESETEGAVALVSKRDDQRNLLDEAEKKGYQLVFTNDDLRRAENGRILGLFAESGFPYRIDIPKEAAKRTLPTLSEMTSKALTMLSKNDNGFFLMVESGIIDWAEHDNDVGALLHEMLRFDEVLSVLHAFVRERDDTLFIVTADHETGGFGFSYSRRDIPEAKNGPGGVFENQRFKPSFNFGRYTILDKIFAQKKSFKEIFRIYDSLIETKREGDEGARNLMAIVNDASAFPITFEEAKRVLEVEPNAYRVAGHADLDRPTFPRIDDYEAFYVYGDDVRRDLLARILGEKQNVVWATGAHTSTPVPFVALGPKDVVTRFGRLMHSTTWAKMVLSCWEE
jgi:alkaline phosphatase